ncbi:hypothetical protein M3Y99_00580000 [Aphelenchoides fujianensis]|nr:hypothetical protein M3Y99_00580000 [Aphelenchoides fujianensis]
MVVCHGYRYWILLLGCLCMTSISSNMYTFNIAQVCMSSANNGTMRDAGEGLMTNHLSKEELADIERVRRNSMMSVAGAVM